MIVPAKSQSSLHTPGVVGLCVVVVDVVVVVVVVLGSLAGILGLVLPVAVLAASNNFSIDIGVVDGVGHPVNSVVALKFQRCLIS